MNKLTIVFAMHYEAGHILCTFSLAKALRNNGHNVIYLSLPECKNTIESQGFKVVTFFDGLERAPYGKKPPTIHESRRRAKRVFESYLETITDGTLDACLKAINADIVICDPFLSYVGMRSLLLGIPTAHLFTSLFTYENKYIPPITSYLYPKNPLRTLLAWKTMFLKFFFVKKLKNIFTREFSSPMKMHHLVGAYRKIAKESGYPCVKNKTYRLNEIGFNLVLPEIVLCAKAFQFPGDIPNDRMYLGNFVDFEREDAQADLGLDDRPLVYCSLGTAASTYPYADRFYRAVMDASAQRKDWNFILQISDERRIKNYNSTDNLIVSQWVPQLSILKKASAMVTHGGLNSIMECVEFEVPMVIVPGLRDQPGNALRAVYHNIALITSMKSIEPDNLIELISKAMASKEIKSGLTAMKNRIEIEDGLLEVVSFIESYAKKA